MHLRTSAPLCLLALSSLLTGCTLENTAAPNVVPGTAISGIAHGGQQAILNAKVYLLAVNPTGYAGPGIAASSSNASISLLNPATTGNAADSIGSYVRTNNTTGGFSVSGDYSCTAGYPQGSSTASVTLSGSEQVYLYILGGTGSQSYLTNPVSGLLVALGPCNSPTTKVTINEVTTVATAYAFAGFATDATHIGSSGTALALTDLANAFTNVGNLVSTSTGTPTSTTISGNGTTPAATVYSIADILAACVNSNGSTTSGSNCATLFQYTASAGATGTAPADTATAAINLAHNPYPTAAGVSALFGLIPATSTPFVGGLSAAPQTFFLPITYTGANINKPLYAAVDALGNFWVANSSTGSRVVSEITPSGSYPFGTAGFNFGNTLATPNGIAFDFNGNLWLSNYQYFNIMSSDGTMTNEFTGPATTNRIAIGGSGVLAADSGKVSYLLSISGLAATLKAQVTTSSDLSVSGMPAFDASGNVWLGGSYSVVEVNSANSSNSTHALGTTGAYALAFDNSGQLWGANASVSVPDLYRANSAGTQTGTFTGGGIAGNFGIAIDSAGTIWLPNYYAGTTSGAGTSVSVFANNGTAISPSSGFTTGSLSGPHDVVIDGSGNVWIPNFTGSTVTEYIGAASPVVTPLAANLTAPYNQPASRP